MKRRRTPPQGATRSSALAADASLYQPSAGLRQLCGAEPSDLRKAARVSARGWLLAAILCFLVAALFLT
jgi:hypothetical protein